MPFLPGLAVVFAGIVGGNSGHLDKQIKSIIHDVHVKSVAMPAARLRTLTHHGEGTREIVKKMHVDGVIGFELVTGHGTPTLRVVIYDAEGGLKTYSEMPLSGPQLDKDDLDALRSNIADDVGSLSHTTIEVPATPAEDIELDPTPPPVTKPLASKTQKPVVAPTSDIGFVAPTKASEDAPVREAAPTQTADDSVSADDIEAMTGGGETPTDGGEIHANSASENALRMQAAVGLGVASRSFSPTPSTVAPYSSSPVGTVHLDANVQPTPRTNVGVVAETTLAMTTPLHNSVAATTIARWEATTSYTAYRGIVDLAPLIGMGRRSFSIDSTDPSRSPDGDYNYVILGATAAKTLSDRLSMHGVLAIEPVVSGTDPTEMAFGSASRWALDIGAGVEYRPRSHIFMRATADYQRFSWSWDMAGARGAGGAVDGYPSGALSLGAEY